MRWWCSLSSWNGTGEDPVDRTVSGAWIVGVLSVRALSVSSWYWCSPSLASNVEAAILLSCWAIITAGGVLWPELSLLSSECELVVGALKWRGAWRRLDPLPCSAGAPPRRSVLSLLRRDGMLLRRVTSKRRTQENLLPPRVDSRWLVGLTYLKPGATWGTWGGARVDT